MVVFFVLCFKTQCMQLDRIHFALSLFFFGMLFDKDLQKCWCEKWICVLVYKGMCYDVGCFKICYASLRYSWFCSILYFQLNICIKLYFGAVSFVNTLHALLSLSLSSIRHSCYRTIAWDVLKQWLHKTIVHVLMNATNTCQFDLVFVFVFIQLHRITLFFGMDFITSQSTRMTFFPCLMEMSIRAQTAYV